MDTGAAMPPPRLDAARIAAVRDALAGGHLALGPERDLAAVILARHPGTAELVQRANAFHIRAANWAVTGGSWEDGGVRVEVPPAAGVIFGAAGYPIPGGFHSGAARISPGARFAYAAEAGRPADLNRALLACADPGRVFAFEGSTRKPGALLSAPEARAVGEPVQLQLQLCVQWWPGDFAAWAVGEYARLLPSGSTLVMSLGILGGGPRAEEFLSLIGQAGGTIYPHTADEAEGWVKGAGLILTPWGITDVRAREKAWPEARYAALRPVARVIEAVALVP